MGLPVAPEKIVAHAAELLPWMRETLRRYALAESPTGDPAALAHFADLVEADHRQAGGTAVRTETAAGPHLVTDWAAGTEQTAGHLLVLGHLDTVWPVGQLARMPYTDDGTRITGPGVYDMKGGLVVLQAALRILAALGTAPAQPVRAVLIADEEIGSPDGVRLVQQGVAGAVAALGLEPPHPGGGLKTGRFGSARFRLAVTGREAHAALDPEKGISAVDELVDQLLAVRAAIPSDGSALCNIGRVEGGTRANVVAGQAWAEIGLRFRTPEAERVVLPAVTGAGPVRPGAVLDVRPLSARPAWQPPAEGANALLAAVAAAGREVGQRVEGAPAVGGGDTNLPGSLGLPTLDGLGPLGQGAHAVHEAIEVASLVERAALLAAVLATPLGDLADRPA